MNRQSLLERYSDLHILGECFSVDGTTKALSEETKDRLHLLPAADNALMGVAIGMAMDGAKVILELASPQSLWGIISQLGQETTSSFPLTIVIRVPMPPNEMLPWEILEGLGVDVWCPRTHKQRQQVINDALSASTPTIILEPSLSLQQRGSSLDCPAAEQIKEGEDATLIAWGDNVEIALQTAQNLENEAIFVEVIALQKLLPVNSDLLKASVDKTGRPVFIRPPQQLLHRLIEQSFWRLESQPLATGSTEQEIRNALFESLS